MENIRRWFENDKVNNGQDYEIYEYEGHLEARTDTVIFMIVEPHSGTRNRWLLRVTKFEQSICRAYPRPYLWCPHPSEFRIQYRY